MQELEPEVISLRLQVELPGRAAQRKMAPSSRKLTIDAEDTDASRDSGVLIPLFPYGTGWGTLFIERTPHGPHGGQISFPGGGQEPCDRDAVEAALREADEEVGLHRSRVEVLGLLTQLFVPVSNFMITPVVGLVREPPEWLPDEREVAGVIPVALDELFHRSTKKTCTIVRHGAQIEAPYYDVQGHMVWGATAMILSELEVVLREAHC